MAGKEGKGTVAVTGASRGIGAAIALELARRGFRVACLTRAGLGVETEAVPADLAPLLTAYRCDVTDEAAISAALAAAVAETGPLTGLVNNAGIQLHGESASFSTADFERSLAVDATAVFVTCREAHPYLVAAGGGTIVNIGSFFDRMGVPNNTAYCAAKAAVGAITRCLAVEWAGANIQVVNIAPGYIETDLNREFLARESVREYMASRIPGKRPGTPDQVARMVGAVFTEALPYLSGETIYLDGAHAIAH